MRERSALWAAVAGAGLLAACCGGPLLVGAIGVSAVLAIAAHLIWPAAGLTIVLAGLALYQRVRRGNAPAACCDARTKLRIPK